MRKRLFCSLIVLLVFGQGRLSRARELSGHIKSLNVVQKGPREEAYQGFTNTQVRFDILVNFSEAVKMDYAQLADLLVGPGSRANSPFELVNMDATPINEQDTVVSLHPDRLNLNWASGKFSAVIGRQAIGFGNLLGFSPMDLIAPFSPLALDTDIRPGVDALKIDYYPTDFSVVTGVAVVSRASANQSYLLLYTLAGEEGDFNLLLGESREKPCLGLGYSRDLRGMGLRAEGLFLGAQQDNSGYATAGLEADYRFANDLYVDLEFFYNGDGAQDPKKYQQGVFFPGRYYAILNSSYDFTPLLKFSPALVANLGDSSMMASLRFTYSISDNSEVLAFINLALGRSPAPDNTRRSEYGSAPHGGGLFLRLFF